MKGKFEGNNQNILWSTCYELLRRLPIKEDKIFFESFMGKEYSGNPKAIYEELMMAEKKQQLKYVWSLNTKQFIPGNAIRVKSQGIKYFYELATAKYVVTNSSLPSGYRKKENQVCIQTWRGTPLKYVGFDQIPTINNEEQRKKVQADLENDVNNWDYLVTSNPYSSNLLKNAFDFKGEIVEVGSATTDELSNLSNYHLHKLREKYQINDKNKVLLYVPTSRIDQETDAMIHQIKLNLDLVAKRCSEWKILVKKHPFVDEITDCAITNERIIFVDETDDLNHLMVLSDALLTDYSSIMFDYATLKKPMIFNGFDVAKFEKSKQGFYQPFQPMIPGKNITKAEELVKILKNLKNYQKQHEQLEQMFTENYCKNNDGKVTRRIIKKILGGKRE